MLAFDEANNLRYGPASAYATVLFVYVVIVAILFVKLLGADVVGEAKARKKDKEKKVGNPPVNAVLGTVHA
jgi:multiple sugar transport system permease protein